MSEPNFSLGFNFKADDTFYLFYKMLHQDLRQMTDSKPVQCHSNIDVVMAFIFLELQRGAESSPVSKYTKKAWPE